MRVPLLLLPAVLLLGCAPDAVDPREACLTQGHAPGTEAFRVCMDAGGAAIATGPGSPWANVDEEENGD